ncbi:hypothetical protein BSZ05_22815 [Vibrio mediterranei]|uniref:HD-GYP domain-containing protein n=1 Tax=Vibrio mediterranei TaxID=689 RepID=A0AAN1KQG9_9VIBR|nr:hypothetical protein BSZ05_22815 [Vibrio mediterranei]
MIRCFKNATFSIRVAIGTLFILITALTSILLLSAHYKFAYSTLKKHQLDEYSLVSEEVAQKIKSADSQARHLTRSLANIIASKNSIEQWQPILLAALESNPEVYSLYVGTNTDEFYQIINLDLISSSSSNMKLEESDRWVFVYIHRAEDGKQRKTVTFVDESLHVREQYSLPSKFLPSQRPWFQSALSGDIVKTEPYLFQNMTTSGQTYAFLTPSGHAVVGVDILLSTTSDMLSEIFKQHSSEAFVFRQTGEMVASTRSSPAENTSPNLPLLTMTKTEQALIQKANPLRISNQKHWAPMDYNVLGVPRGYSIDILKMITQMTGIQWEFVNGLDWSTFVRQFNNHSLDALHSLQHTQDGYIQGAFSDPIFSLPFGILVPEHLSSIQSITDLNGEKIALVSGWSILPTLSLPNNYSEIEIIEVNSLFMGIELLKSGEVSGLIDSSIVLKNITQQYFIDDVSVVEDIAPFNQGIDWQFHIVLREKYSELLPVINRAISKIINSEQANLQQKWQSDLSMIQHRLVPHPIFYELMASPQKHGHLVNVLMGSKETYIYLQPVSASTPKEFLAIVLPAEILHKQVLNQVYQTAEVTALLVIPMLWLAWFFGTPIIRTVKSLEQKTLQIQSKDYQQLKPVHSRIRELSLLSKSIGQMATQLQANEKQQEILLDSIIELIAGAIDAKSPYTAKHCSRVPILAMMLADAAESSRRPPFENFCFRSEQEKREFRIAAWLHDCGKLTVPEHIVDKGTKLEANYNRLHEIRMRFEVLWRDIELEGVKKQLNGEPEHQVTTWINGRHKQLQREFSFIASLNTGETVVTEEDIAHLKKIGAQTWARHFDDTIGLSPFEKSKKVHTPEIETLLKDAPEHKIERYHSPSHDYGIKMDAPHLLSNLGEIYNLSITRGTLTKEDRYRINEHMVSGIKMLESLPFPNELKSVPRLATTHHETLSGKGYPRKLSAEDLSTKDRILAIADIFEALTSGDRPYKKAFPMNKVLAIMSDMVQKEQIDADLYSLFIEQEIHLRYAHEFLKPEEDDS